MATPPEVQTEANRNQVVLIVGVLVALLAVMWFVFLRGGSDETEAPLTPALSNEEPVPVATEEPDEERPDKGPVETFEVFAPKDPFDPLIEESSGGGGGTGVGTNDSGVIVDDTGGNGGGDGTGDPDTTPDGGGGENVGGHRVRLIDVFAQGGNQTAQVQVDGTVYTVQEGETFAENFRLVSISGQCATMLFGDDQFTLCEGEEILK